MKCSHLKHQVKQARINAILKEERIQTEIDGHIVPRLSQALILNELSQVKEQIMLVLAGLEDISDINKDKE